MVKYFSFSAILSRNLFRENLSFKTHDSPEASGGPVEGQRQPQCHMSCVTRAVSPRNDFLPLMAGAVFPEVVREPSPGGGSRGWATLSPRAAHGYCGLAKSY